MLIGIILGLIVAILVNAPIIWIVSKLNLGLHVKNFGSAIAAALVIAFVTWVITWVLGLVGISIGGGLVGAIVGLIVAAVVLMISDKLLSGLEVDGFVGAIIAAIGIGFVTWLITFVLSLLGAAFS